MADSKISGLPAVAAFATTQEFVVNDSGTSRKISGTQLAAAFPQGTMGYAQTVSAQGSITTITDLTGLTITFTAVSGRRYRITGYSRMASSVAGDRISLYVTDGSNNILEIDQINQPSDLGTAMALKPMIVTTPSGGSITYKLRAERTAGTGNVVTSVGTTDPAFILVEDIGV